MITKFWNELKKSTASMAASAMLLGAVILIGLAFLQALTPTSAQAQQAPLGPLGATVVPVATNIYGPAPTNSIPASSTNVFPATYVYTNVYSNIYANPVTYTTNIVTNTVTGFIDLSKVDDVAIQVGYQCTNANNLSNVIWKFMPSLDGINPDSTNAAFWITNTSPGSNVLVYTTNFASNNKGGIAGFFLTQVINLNTNPIFPYLTNSTGSNYQFLQVRGRRTPVY